MTHELTIDALAAVPRSMGASVRVVYENPSRERYVRFLNLMVHYTRFAGEELRSAASVTSNGELRALFEDLAREEHGHHRLAEADLRGLGESVDQSVPDSVLAYRSYWASLGENDEWKFLGVLYALENVARFAGEDAWRSLGSLALSPEQSRFVRVHIQADEAHGHEVARCCERFLGEHGGDILVGARCGAELWVAMHLSILDEPGLATS